MRIAAVSCLLAVFIVLSSCGQTYPLDDLSGDDLLGNPAEPDDIAGYSPSSDDLIGAPASSANLTPPRLFPGPVNDDEYFFNYRLEKFAPDTEPFIKKAFGSELGIKRAGL
jgi:hypothetical protein